jgi:hypothetical protein
MNPSGTSERLLIYLRTLAGNPRPGGHLDVRWRTATRGMGRRFVPARDTSAVACLIAQLGWTFTSGGASNTHRISTLRARIPSSPGSKITVLLTPAFT